MIYRKEVKYNLCNNVKFGSNYKYMSRIYYAFSMPRRSTSCVLVASVFRGNWC